MKRKIILWLSLTWVSGSLFATNLDSLKQPIPLKISVLDESISFPNFWFTRYDLNPAIMVGTEIILKEKRNHDWHWTGNVGFYHHKHWQNAVFVNSELGYRQHFGRFSANARLGIGYAHTFAASKVYKLDDGEWTEVTDWGNPTFMPSLALGVEYKLRDENTSPAVFLTYMSSGEIPFTIFTGLHQMVGVGFKFFPFTSTNG